MTIDESLRRLLHEHDRAGAPLSDCLADGLSTRRMRKLERRVAGQLPQGVAALHLLADGIAHDALDRAVGRPINYPFFPGGPAFMSGWDAATAATELRTTAQDLSRDPGMDGVDVPWRSTWALAYQIGGGEALAVDVTDTGSLWLVQWENSVVAQLEVDMQGFLDACADWMATIGPTWNPQGFFEYDYSAAAELPFPGLTRS